MRLAQVTVVDIYGQTMYEGGLHEFARLNEMEAADVASLAAELRGGPAVLGGGAAPLFFVGLQRS